MRTMSHLRPSLAMGQQLVLLRPTLARRVEKGDGTSALQTCTVTPAPSPELTHYQGVGEPDVTDGRTPPDASPLLATRITGGGDVQYRTPEEKARLVLVVRAAA